MSENRDKLIAMLEEGMLDPEQLAFNLILWLSDEGCKEFAAHNDIELFPEEEFEFSDEDEVREAFSEFWNDRCDDAPGLRTDKPAKRMAFSCFVDDLQRDGRISDDLANDVTLGDDD